MIRLLMLLLLFFALLVAMIAGPSLIGEKGYVLIAMGNVTIELSVVSLLFIVILAVIGFLVMEWGVKRVIRLLGGSRVWFGGLSERRTRVAYFKGITAYFEGDLERSNKWLSKAKDGDFNGVNLLAAGQVAAELGDDERAEILWMQAAEDTEADYAAKVCIPGTPCS